MVDKALFSSESTEWETPHDLFNYLQKIYLFTLDPCATKENAKCEKFYTKEDDGMQQDWSGHTVFMNPPYRRGIIDRWVEKAYIESKLGHSIVVCLLPSRTDTKWWHSFVMKAHRVMFIKGRVSFVGAEHAAPFPSAVVVFNGEESRNRMPLMSRLTLKWIKEGYHETYTSR